MNVRENNQISKNQNDAQGIGQFAATCRQHLLAQAETLLDRIDTAQQQIQDLQNDISLLQTAENALDLLSENLASIRRLTLEKKQFGNCECAINELNDQIGNLLTVNTLIADDTEFNGHHLFKDDVIHLTSCEGADLWLVTTKLPEIAGLETNDIQATLDSLSTTAEMINRQYENIASLMRILLDYYERLRAEFKLLLKAQAQARLLV